MSIVFPVNQAPWTGGVVGGILESSVGGGGGGTTAAVSVETVELTVTATSHTVNLTKGQNYAQCVPFASWCYSDTSASNHGSECGLVIEIVDNSGTAAVKVTRQEANDQTAMGLTVYVVEFGDGIGVQQITWDGPAATASPTVSCAEVDTDYAFLIDYGTRASNGSLDDMDGNFAKTSFSSSTEITFSRAAADDDFEGVVYVVEDLTGGDHFNVQVATAATNALGNIDRTITAVDRTATFLVGSCATTETGKNSEDTHWYATLHDEDTVRFTVGGDAGDIRDMLVQVIEWTDGSVFVQHVADDYTSDTTADVETSNVALPVAVNAAASVALGNYKTWCGINSPAPNTSLTESTAARMRIASNGEALNVSRLTRAAAVLTNLRGWVAEFTL